MSDTKTPAATTSSSSSSSSATTTTTTPAASAAAATAAAGGDIAAALTDKAFLDELLDDLPGVDKNEINIDELLDSMQPDAAKKKEEKK